MEKNSRPHRILPLFSMDLGLNCGFERQLCYKPSGFLVIVKFAHSTKEYFQVYYFLCDSHAKIAKESYLRDVAFVFACTVALSVTRVFEKLLTNVKTIPSK